MTITQHDVRCACLFLSTLIAINGHSQTSVRVNAREDSPGIREANSKYFTDYGSLYTISAELRYPINAGKESVVISRTVGFHNTSGTGRSPERWSYLWLEAANADAVILGRPISQFTAFTADKTFLFTDYVFQVEEVKQDGTRSVNPGDRLVVTRAGGVLNFEGKAIHAVDPDFPQYEMNGRYTLFLHKLPGSTAFRVTADDTFLLKDGRAFAGRTSHALSKSEAEFMEDVDSAIEESR